VRQLLTFEYSSVHGALAAAYTSGALAAEFGPEHVCVRLAVSPEEHVGPAPLLTELAIPDAEQRSLDTRLLGVVHDDQQATWALLTSHVSLQRDKPLLVRALGAILQARPHRRPVLDPRTAETYGNWLDDTPLRAANILINEDFVAGTTPLAA
jgi:hypothetical protein